MIGDAVGGEERRGDEFLVASFCLGRVRDVHGDGRFGAHRASDGVGEAETGESERKTLLTLDSALPQKTRFAPLASRFGLQVRTR